MEKGNLNIPYRESKRWTCALTLFIALLGIIFILIANLIPQEPRFWSVSLTTIGIAFFISGTISLLQRYFSAELLYNQVRADLDIIVRDALETSFDLIESCSELGIRKIYPEWSAFLESILPKRLESQRISLTVVGSGLTGFSVSVIGGSLKKVVDRKLDEGKNFVFCLLKPGSPAARYREQELHQKDSATSAATSSLAYLNNLKNRHQEKNIVIKTLSEVVPKFTYVCIDEEYLFISPYFSSKPTVSSWVIETHRGDYLFEALKTDLDNLLKNSEPWMPVQINE